MKAWDITLKINNSRKCILNIIFTASGCEKFISMYLSSGLHLDTWAWALSMDLSNLIHPLIQPLPCFNYRNHQCYKKKSGVTRCCITERETFRILSVNSIFTYARNPRKTTPNHYTTTIFTASGAVHNQYLSNNLRKQIKKKPIILPEILFSKWHNQLIFLAQTDFHDSVCFSVLVSPFL